MVPGGTLPLGPGHLIRGNPECSLYIPALPLLLLQRQRIH